MDTLFHYTGMTVWAVIALMGLWLAIEIIVGFGTAVSWTRWTYRGARKHGRKLRWHRFPDSFARQWFEFVGYRNRGNYTLSREDGGVWRGIGDWNDGRDPVDKRD